MERPHQSGTATTPDGDVLFCAFCRVSVSQREVARGVAIRTPAGRTFCGFCVTATPDERERRRQELENEFADDAPVPSPAPVVVSRAAEPRPAPSLSAADELLLARVGELERSTFRLRARVHDLEERLAAIVRRLEL